MQMRCLSDPSCQNPLNVHHAHPLPLRHVFCIPASASVAAQLELTFRLGPFDTDGYQIVLSGSCHVWTSAGHTQGLIRGIHGSWWVMFFLSPAGPQSSVAASQPEESGWVNGIKRDTVDLCICFGRGFLCNEWNLGQLGKMAIFR